MFDLGGVRPPGQPSPQTWASPACASSSRSTPAEHEELLAFLGASYFRAVGRGTRYGLSARGLAVDTGLGRARRSSRPSRGSGSCGRPTRSTRSTMYALLDSQSVTGAYRFVIGPGDADVMDVDASLFFPHDVAAARHRALHQHVLLRRERPGRRRRLPAARSTTRTACRCGRGNGEWLLAPAGQPDASCASACSATRTRAASACCSATATSTHYQDLDSRYDLRPSLWVEPKGALGQGLGPADRDPDTRRDQRQHRRVLDAR